MSGYLVAIGQRWGDATFETVVRPGEVWERIHHATDLTPVLVAAARYVFLLNWNHCLAPRLCTAGEIVNFHLGRLPDGRGGHPIENAILHGHEAMVITAHRVTAQIDAGPIYGVSEPVSLAGSKDEILARFVEPCATLMRWIVETEPTPTPQAGVPTYFKRLSPVAYQAFWEQRRRE